MYNNKSINIPFTGNYELVDNYSTIFIYIDTSGNDTLKIEFTNKENDNDCEIYDQYTINNTSQELIIHPKLKYFRIKIESNDDDSTNRIYNVYFNTIQMMATDENGHVVISSQIEGIDLSGIIIDQNDSSICIYDSEHGSILTDACGNLRTTVRDGNDNSINVDAGGNLRTTVRDGNDNSIIINSNGGLIVAQDKYNLNLDAFCRTRMSIPYTIFDSKNISKQNDKFTSISKTSGAESTANINYHDNTSTITLEVSANARIINESKCTFSYQPGKSLLILNTFCFDDIYGTGINSMTNKTTQRVGYFDDDNGIFLEINQTDVRIVLRNNNSDVRYASINGTGDNTFSGDASGWNGDTTFTENMDFTKSQIFWIDVEWLGVGSIRTGFVINGQFRLAHTFNNSNLNLSVTNPTYMTSAQLPIRYEIIGTNTLSIKKLTKICSSVISEGGYAGKSIIRHVQVTSNDLYANLDISGSGSRNINTNIPFCAIRIGNYSSSNITSNTTDTSGNVIYNSIIIPSQASLFLTGIGGNTNSIPSIVQYKLVFNPSGTLNNANWHTEGTVQYQTRSDISGSNLDLSGSIVGKTIINSGFIDIRTSFSLGSPNDFNLQLGRNIVQTSLDSSLTGRIKYNSDILVLYLTPIYKGPNNNDGVTQAIGSLGWYEL